MGAQGTIIGPTRAISAALTSLKGAARRVRKASSHPPVSSSTTTNSSTVDGGGSGTGSGSGSGEDGPGGRGAAEDRGGKPTSVAVSAKGDVDGEGRGYLSGGGGKAAVAAGGFVSVAVESGDGGAGGGVFEDGGAIAAAVSEGREGSVFGEEARRYEIMLDAMVRGIVVVSYDARRGPAVLSPVSALARLYVDVSNVALKKLWFRIWGGFFFSSVCCEFSLLHINLNTLSLSFACSHCRRTYTSEISPPCHSLHSGDLFGYNHSTVRGKAIAKTRRITITPPAPHSLLIGA